MVKEEKVALTRPAQVERGWQVKVEKAREAREAGKQLRKGKTPAFPTRRALVR